MANYWPGHFSTPQLPVVDRNSSGRCQASCSSPVGRHNSLPLLMRCQHATSDETANDMTGHVNACVPAGKCHAIKDLACTGAHPMHCDRGELEVGEVSEGDYLRIWLSASTSFDPVFCWPPTMPHDMLLLQHSPTGCGMPRYRKQPRACHLFFFLPPFLPLLAGLSSASSAPSVASVALGCDSAA